MKSFIAGLAIAVPLMFGAAPGWADDDHDHGRHSSHWNKHAEKEWKREHKQWRKHQRQAERRYYRDHYSREVVVHHYAPPVRQPRYYASPVWAPAPAPGVHIVMPDVYIPF